MISSADIFFELLVDSGFDIERYDIVHVEEQEQVFVFTYHEYDGNYQIGMVYKTPVT